MTTIQQVKAALTARLTDAGLAAMSAFEEERLKRYAASVTVVGVREIKIERAGLLDYLGVRRDEQTASPVEVYGRTMELSLSVDVYAPREKGAGECETAAEAAAQALLSGLPSGLRVESFAWGRTAWDRASGMFLLPGAVRCTALFAAEAEPESAVLRDFILRGVLTK